MTTALVLATGAILLTADLKTAALVLSQVVLIGFGLAVIGGRVAVDAEEAVAVVMVGVAVIGTGVTSLFNRQVLEGVVLFGAGVAAIKGGVTMLADRQTLGVGVFIAVGVAVILVGGLWLFFRLILEESDAGSVMVVGIGITVIGTGVTSLFFQAAPTSVALVAAGVAIIELTTTTPPGLDGLRQRPSATHPPPDDEENIHGRCPD
jgi:hypothetical protein